MTRRRRMPLVPESREALEAFRRALEAERRRTRESPIVTRFKQLARELVEREQLR
jgi:hypothetical protein